MTCTLSYCRTRFTSPLRPAGRSHAPSFRVRCPAAPWHWSLLCGNLRASFSRNWFSGFLSRPSTSRLGISAMLRFMKRPPSSRRSFPSSLEKGGCPAPVVLACTQRLRADELACKPDSVPLHAAQRRRPSICDTRRRMPDAAYPQARASSPRAPAQPHKCGLLALLRVGFTEPSRSPGMLVRSYRTVSPLPPKGGGLFSVALSRGSPRIAVNNHPAL